MSEFENTYKTVLDNLGSNLSANESSYYADNVQSAIDNVVKLMKDYAYPNKALDYVKGDIAEGWHEGTYNVNAAVKELKDVYAKSPKDSGTVDIIGYSPNEIILAQLKYWKTPEATCKAISSQKYHGLIKIVPLDQLEGVKDAAYRLYLHNLNSRPEQAQQYLDTYYAATDRLSGKVESTPISETEMKQIAKELVKDKFKPEKHGLVTENFITWSDIARESGKAALSAALITAALKAAPHLYVFLKDYIVNGRINNDAFKTAGIEFIYGAGSGAIRGGISAAITASCKSGLLGESLKNVNPNIIAGATVVAMNSIVNSVKLYKGEISQAEFVDNCLRDSIAVSMGIWGAGIGQSCIPIPILGALIGNLIGSTVGVIAYEGSKQILISFLIENDLPFFNIIKQDYTIPRNILEKTGLDLIELDMVEFDKIELDRIELDRFELITMDIRALKRGLIKMNVIGYNI